MLNQPCSFSAFCAIFSKSCKLKWKKNEKSQFSIRYFIIVVYWFILNVFYFITFILCIDFFYLFENLTRNRNYHGGWGNWEKSCRIFYKILEKSTFRFGNFFRHRFTAYQLTKSEWVLQNVGNRPVFLKNNCSVSFVLHLIQRFVSKSRHKDNENSYHAACTYRTSIIIVCMCFLMKNSISA